MLTAHFDCFAGASGDMLLGSLLDAGVPLENLRDQLNKLNLTGYDLEAVSVVKQGLSAINFKVIIEKSEHNHRKLRGILTLLENSGLKPAVITSASRIFQQLAAAEAKIHGISPEEVHFHEVGALDSILDIVGVCIALDYLGIGHITCSSLPLGWGIVKCHHGLLPVPAPATLELVKGLPTTPGLTEGEVLTPTGAAILATLSNYFGPPPPMIIRATGYGAGTKDLPIANVCRVWIGESQPAAATAGWLSDEIEVIETNIDDLNPEIYQYVMEKLLNQGALDVFLTPVIMKKSRPGTLVKVLAPLEKRAALVDTLLKETSALGVRLHRCSRLKAHRNVTTVETPYGPVQVKYAWQDEGDTPPLQIAPEYEDCAARAKESGVPIKEVYRQAEAIALGLLRKE
ncbi:MAG: nickel pincer cofactor biosynthesis protein LarC [Clostridia bacterium]|nr:nickel pincer cofactor biosynthesis protein LarC [Clostridia bacterium]